MREEKTWDEIVDEIEKSHGIKNTYPEGREQAFKDEFNQKRMEEDMVITHGEKTAVALRPLSSVARLTQDQAMHILDTIWPGAPKIEKMKAAMLCHDYKLNPLKKHLALIKFKNKNGGEDWVTVLSIDVDRLFASRQGRYAYIDNTPRIMTNREQETIFGKVDTTKIWAICKIQDAGGGEAAGYGFWPADSQPYGTDKGNTAFNMAFIRAERQALRKLYPSEMPSDIEGLETMEAEHMPNDANNVIEGEARDISDAKELPPNDANLGKEAPHPSEAEGIRAADNVIPFPKLSKLYGDMMAFCWQHGDAWTTNRFKRRSHQVGEDWCNFADALKPITQKTCEQQTPPMDALALNEKCKAKYQNCTWSKLTEYEQLSVLEGML